MRHSLNRVIRTPIRKSGRLVMGAVLVAAIFTSGFMLGSVHPAIPALAQDATPADSKLFAPFWEAWNLMHRSFVDPLDDNVLLEGALNGMMAAPGDKFTNYFDPSNFKATTDELAGQYTGIGATVKKDEKSGALQIVDTIAGAPARAAGVLPGDKIFQVDGQDITKLDQNQIVTKVRGKVGTTVQLGILRNDTLPLITISVMRSAFVVPDVVTHLYAGNIGYISLSEFGSHAATDFEAGLKTLNADKLNGLIIDLRGNPGGYVDAAVSIASQFIPSGVIYSERGKNGSESSAKAIGHPLAAHVPLVVLVDGGSASAAELVSGALQDTGRAKLLGTQTYGKGSAQIIEQLSNGGAAHITIARWYTPKGRTIQGVGLTPDYAVVAGPTAPADSGDQPDIQLERALLVLRGEV